MAFSSSDVNDLQGITKERKESVINQFDEAEILGLLLMQYISPAGP